VISEARKIVSKFDVSTESGALRTVPGFAVPLIGAGYLVAFVLLSEPVIGTNSSQLLLGASFLVATSAILGMSAQAPSPRPAYRHVEMAPEHYPRQSLDFRAHRSARSARVARL
jgi:hypothetical protein